MHIGFHNLVNCSGNRAFSFVATYKSEFLARFWWWQSQSFDVSRCLPKNLPVLVILRKLQDIATAVVAQLGWQHQELIANSFYRGCEIPLRQTQTFEPMNQIIGQQEQLHEGHIGQPLLSWNFVQGKIIEQFSDRSLDVGARLVGFPNSPRFQFQVGHKCRIGISTDTQQGQLAGLLWVFGQRPSHHDKPMFSFPTARFKTKFRHCPTRRPCFKSGPVRHRQVGLSLLANNDIAQARLVQVTDELSGVKSRIGQQPNPRPSHLRRYFLQTTRHKIPGSSIRGRGSGAQRPMPELLAMSFEAQQRMVGRPASFLWIITDPRSLLLAVESQDHRVQVKHQAGSLIRKIKQLCPHLIVQSSNLPNRFGREPMQKAAQRCLIWKSVQPNQGTKQSIIPKKFSLVDPRKPSNQYVQKHQNQIRRMIIHPARSGSENAFQSAAQTQLVAKSLNQEQTSKVREGLRFK